MPTILMFCVVGSFAINNSAFGITVMLVFGLLGFVMEENGFPIAPTILGIVLGPMLEENFVTSMIKSGGSFAGFFERPISGTLGVITLEAETFPWLGTIIGGGFAVVLFTFTVVGLPDKAVGESRERVRGAFAGIVFIAVAEAAVISYLLPLKEIIPITTHVRDDGTTTTAVKWESLPKPVREDVTVNVVWSYVQQRESWSAGNAGWAWTMVSALSAPRVRESFQNWYRADNPQSPAQIYKDMTVEANFVRWEPICPIEKACLADGPPAYRVWFDRVETLPDGKRMPPVRYAATVAIRRNVELPQDRIWQRWTFNAPQIQVIEYAGAQREGVSR